MPIINNEYVDPFVCIVFEGADVDAVVEVTNRSVFDKTAPKVLYVQESIVENVSTKISTKLKLSAKEKSIGSDISNFVSDIQSSGANVEKFQSDNGVFVAAVVYDGNPTPFLSNPILHILPFGTSEEAVELFNNLGCLSGAAIWGADYPLCIGTAKKLNAVDVTINHYDAEKFRTGIFRDFKQQRQKPEIIAELQKLTNNLDLSHFLNTVAVPAIGGVIVGRSIGIYDKVNFTSEESDVNLVLLSVALGNKVWICTSGRALEFGAAFQMNIESILPGVTLVYSSDIEVANPTPYINKIPALLQESYQLIHLPLE